MKELAKGEYLAPETEVVNLTLGSSVLQVLSPGIEDSTENPTVDW